MAPRANANFEQFLTPEAMLTPGIAGSMSMMIGNTLHYQFAVPNGWAFLVLSFIFGLLVLATNKPLLTKSVLYVLNSLVIFCVAAGTTTTLSATSSNTRSSDWFSLTRPAYAQATTSAQQAEYDKLSADYAALGLKIDAARQRGVSGPEIDKMVADRAELDRKRAALLRSIINTESRANTPKDETKFFAPLRF